MRLAGAISRYSLLLASGKLTAKPLSLLFLTLHKIDTLLINILISLTFLLLTS